jgi:hypothetical protein
MSERIVWFEIGNHFRRTVDGVADVCPHCQRPNRFRLNAAGDDYVKLEHRCRRHRGSKAAVDEDGESTDIDDEMLEGARIERGFAMISMANEFDYGGGIL